MPLPATIRVSATLDELPRLAGFVEAFAEAQALGAADTFAIVLAAEELFTNTAAHNGRDAIEVELSLARTSAEIVRLTYTDSGAAFDPTKQATPDTALPAGERSIGGLGIHILRQSMEDFSYEREDGLNRITLMRRLSC